MKSVVIPALRITDYDQAKSFYIDGLGFTIEFEHRFEPHFPVFMGLKQDELQLYLSEHEGDCQPGALVYMYVADVDSFYNRLTSAGFTPPKPEDQPWGQREMKAKDPFGNTVCVCHRK